MKEWPGWVNVLLGVMIGLAASAAFLLITRQPVGTPISLVSRPTPPALLVHVSGAVKNPGVYQLAPESRIQDAVDAAGGPTSQANMESLNLAAYVSDSMKIHVLAAGEPAASIDQQSTLHAPQALIDLNTATVDQLMSLPGIGEDRAYAIIEYREQNNGFRSIDELKNIDGIGDMTFDKLQDLVTISPSP